MLISGEAHLLQSITIDAMIDSSSNSSWNMQILCGRHFSWWTGVFYQVSHNKDACVSERAIDKTASMAHEEKKKRKAKQE